MNLAIDLETIVHLLMFILAFAAMYLGFLSDSM